MSVCLCVIRNVQRRVLYARRLNAAWSLGARLTALSVGREILSQHQGNPKPSMSTRKKTGIAVAIVLCAPVVISGMFSGMRQSLDSKHGSVVSTSPLTPASTPLVAAHRASGAKRSQAATPSFVYPGDPQCSITYRGHGKTAMSWTAKVTLAGQLITHASDVSGNLYRHVVHVTPGPKRFIAPVPLAQINDIGGVLYVRDATYGCSIAPQRNRGRHNRHAAAPPAASSTSVATAPPPPATPPSAAPLPAATGATCFPLSVKGTCYEPGEYCRESDQGMTGVAGDGEKIICEDNNGLRWEPA